MDEKIHYKGNNTPPTGIWLYNEVYPQKKMAYSDFRFHPL